MFLKGRFQRFISKINSYENMGDMGGGWGSEQGQGQGGGWGDNGAGYDSWGGGGMSSTSGGRVSGNYGAPGTGTGGDFGSMGRADAIAQDMIGKLKADPVSSIALSIMPGGWALAYAGAYISGISQAKGYSSGPNSISGEQAAEQAAAEAMSNAKSLGGFEKLPESVRNVLGITAEGGPMPGTAQNITAEGTNMDTKTDIPASIPKDIQPGLQQFVTNSNKLTDDYNTKSNDLWNDYLDFENVYFNKYQDVQTQYQKNLDSIPKLNMTLPSTLGGGTVPLAPKAHSTMYANQANTLGDLITKQGNAALSGMNSRNAINQNAFNVGQTGLTNALMPTNTALDLYKMERAGQLGINQAQAAADASKPSTLSTWAPVVGSLLSTSAGNNTPNISSLWSFVKGLF